MRSRWIISTVIAVLLLTVLLDLIFSVHIGIPCLWKTAFGFSCPGCGMTRAFTDILRFNLHQAFHHNPLIFIVLPALTIYIIRDITIFLRKQENSSEEVS